MILPQQQQRVQQLRWLYIDFNSYFASVEQQLRPELRGKPVAVVAVETDFTSAIAASYEAKALGIKTGTPIHEAKRICPDIQCVLARHEHYVDFHNRIQDEVEKHIPITVVASIDEVGCRLMDNEMDEAYAVALAHRIKEGLRQHIGEYVKCSIGIAPNRYLAKIATDMQKPDGLTVLRAVDLPEKLFTLHVRDFPGVGRKMEQRLLRYGISTVRDLWEKDAKTLRRVWGSVWGERMWYYLRGVELDERETERGSVSHSHVLSPEMRSPQGAEVIARRLLLKAASRLRRIAYSATALSLSIRTEDDKRFMAEVRMQPAQDNTLFMDLFQTLWGEVMQASGGRRRIRKVSLVMSGLKPLDAPQADIFNTSDEKRKKAEKLSKIMDGINLKYGRDSIVQGMMPAQGKAFSGTKVAFTRIPDKEEFRE